MYDHWHIARWETPVADVNRLAMVSLTDANRELVILLEASHEPGRPRWRVRFRAYPAYRNIDECYRLALWAWLDTSGQRCGFTFTVDESPRFASWATEYLHEIVPNTRHFVIATQDDVVEVLTAEEPLWEQAEPAGTGEVLPGKATHLYVGEDDEAIERLVADVTKSSIPEGAG